MLKHEANHITKIDMQYSILNVNSSADLILTVLSGSAADGLISST